MVLLTEEKIKQMNPKELEIYNYCYYKPKNIYDIIAHLSDKNITIAYSSLCQKLNIMFAKGYLTKSSKSKATFFRSVPCEAEIINLENLTKC